MTDNNPLPYTPPGFLVKVEPTEVHPPTISRRSWRDFPPSYIEALQRTTQQIEIVRLGPMSWNDVRFSQREFYRLAAALRRNATEGDQDAAELSAIASALRVSCPRCDKDPQQHWLVLKSNPIVKAMQR